MPRSKTLLILLIHHHMPLLLHDLIDAPRLYRSQVSYMHIPDRTCLHNLECILSSQNVTNKAMDHLYYYPHLSGKISNRMIFFPALASFSNGTI